MAARTCTGSDDDVALAVADEVGLRSITDAGL